MFVNEVLRKVSHEDGLTSPVTGTSPLGINALIVTGFIVDLARVVRVVISVGGKYGRVDGGSRGNYILDGPFASSWTTKL